MSEREHRKAMARERIRNDRDLIGLEVENMRSRISSATRLASLGRDLLRPIGAVAAVTTTAAIKGGKAAKANPKGTVTLAALIPVVMAVAKIVSVLAQRREVKAADASATTGARAQ